MMNILKWKALYFRDVSKAECGSEGPGGEKPEIVLENVTGVRPCKEGKGLKP